MSKMSLKERISKTTVANVVAGLCVIGALAFFMYTGNTDGVTFLAGAGVGYLFKEIKERTP